MPVRVSTQACPHCSIGAHEYGAEFCRKCGANLLTEVLKRDIEINEALK